MLLCPDSELALALPKPALLTVAKALDLPLPYPPVECGPADAGAMLCRERRERFWVVNGGSECMCGIACGFVAGNCLEVEMLPAEVL